MVVYPCMSMYLFLNSSAIHYLLYSQHSDITSYVTQRHESLMSLVFQLNESNKMGVYARIIIHN